jgi:acetyl esterase/lipase
MEDAARAIAWCFEHAAEYGFDRSKIFVGGMSAGAYLAAITVMNPAFLAPYGLSYKDLAGLLLISGQMPTHFRVKADLGRNNGPYNPLVDEYAPFSFLSTDLPPMLLVSGDPALDIPARPEENAFFAASLKAMGHPFVRCFSLQGHGHVPAFHSCNHLVKLFLKDVLEGKKENQ